MSAEISPVDTATYVAVSVEWPDDRAEHGRRSLATRIMLSPEEIAAAYIDPVERTLLNAVDIVLDAWRHRDPPAVAVESPEVEQ